jgi:hypothetical protein
VLENILLFVQDRHKLLAGAVLLLCLLLGAFLRFVLDYGQLTSHRPETGRWAQTYCKSVDLSSLNGEPPGFDPRQPGQSTILYDCAG